MSPDRYNAFFKPYSLLVNYQIKSAINRNKITKHKKNTVFSKLSLEFRHSNLFENINLVNEIDRDQFLSNIYLSCNIKYDLPKKSAGDLVNNYTIPKFVVLEIDP